MVDQRKTIPIEKRKEESARILQTYPDRVPVYVMRSSNSALPNIDKYKYLVPNDLTVYHLAYIIRKRINLNSTESMFLYCDGKVLKGDRLVCQLY
jgi:GABA(A) receptor-associated protein